MIKIETEKIPILVWAEATDMVGFDEAIAQAKNLANHPIARQHVALMPDFHVGYGMPIGGVMATKGGVLPNAVGVDIGCGMIAARTDIEAESLDRDTLQAIRAEVHNRVPVGFKQHETPQVMWEGAGRIVTEDTVFVPGHPFHTPVETKHGFDLQRARQILKDAGLPKAF